MEKKNTHFRPLTSGYDTPAYLREEHPLFTFQINLPDFYRKNIQVRIEGEVLIIEGDKGQKFQQKPIECITPSIGFDCFKMQFHLNETIREVAVTALFEHEILKITFHDILSNSKEKIRHIEVM